MDFLFVGIGNTVVAITLMRLSMGVFFTISGYHKLFNKGRHSTIEKTMVDDHVPDPELSSWFVPTAEFAGGIALLVGFLVPPAALGLLVICFGATIIDGLKRIPLWSPIDRADYLDDILYLPEVLYAIILFTLALAGGGPISVDWLILNDTNDLLTIALIFTSIGLIVVFFGAIIKARIN